MELLLSDPYAYLDAFLLVFVRVLGLLLIIPFFGNRSIPYMTKVALTLFISVIVISTLPVQASVSSTDPVNFALAVGKEFFVGFVLGFGAYMVFSVLSLTGQFIDAQIGFSMVNVFDPLSQIQLTITGNLYYYILILIVIVTNAHHLFIRALMDSFRIIPLGHFIMTPYLKDTIFDYFTTYFALALRFAAPVFFIMLITNVVLGVLARAVPNLNMFVIGFPIKIIFGLLTIYVTLTVFGSISEVMVDEASMLMRKIMEGLRP